MIKDAQGRKRFMRFKQYQQGWHWDARHGDHGQEAGFFKTKALAEADARRVIQSRDAIAQGGEYFRRVAMRGSECQLTPEDHRAIQRAGRSR